MHWYVSGLAASLLEALVGIIDQAVADKKAERGIT